MPSYTLTNLEDAAKHAVGKPGGFDTGNSASNCANLALDYLINAHPWSWRLESTTLNLVSGQNYVALPTDFSEIVYLRGGTSTSTAVIPTTLDRIFQMRQQAVSSSSTFIHYAVTQTDQANGTSLATYQIDIYPTPSASTTAAMQLGYMKQIAQFTGGTQVANIPGHMQGTLWWLTRGYAEITENNQPGLNWQQAMQDIEQRKKRDAQTQPVVGRLRGTVEQISYDDEDRFPASTVTV